MPYQGSSFAIADRISAFIFDVDADQISISTANGTVLHIFNHAEVGKRIFSSNPIPGSKNRVILYDVVEEVSCFSCDCWTLFLGFWSDKFDFGVYKRLSAH